MYWDRSTAKFGAKKVWGTPFGKAALGGTLLMLVTKEVLSRNPRAFEAVRKTVVATVHGIQSTATKVAHGVRRAEAVVSEALKRYRHAE